MDGRGGGGLTGGGRGGGVPGPEYSVQHRDEI